MTPSADADGCLSQYSLMRTQLSGFQGVMRALSNLRSGLFIDLRA